MTTVLLIGDGSDTGIEGLIKSSLNSYQITYVKEGEIVRIGEGYEILVLDVPRIEKIDLSECVAVLKAGFSAPMPILPEKGIIIANSENTEQLIGLKGAKRVVTCGSGERDTLSYTSLTSDGIVVALNREITAFSGKKIQPLEIPVRLWGELESFYEHIAFTALRLILDDCNSEIGALY